MRGSITLTTLEQRRLSVLVDVEAGRLGPAGAAELLGISVRQLRRVRAAYRERGVQALIHGNRGRPPANTLAGALAPRVVELATTTYAGFNQHHFTEMLAEHEGLTLSRSTVRRILTEAGVPAPHRRRPPRHRQRRDRYPREGMLLQVDGSRHDWLEGRGPYLSLVGAIDDATGLVPSACFREQEDAQGYFTVMRQVVQRHGIPYALYSDQHSIFMVGKGNPTLEEQLTGSRRPTQFGRLLDELGVRLILARSPQAKGRVERLWGTFQDRLTSELRLAGAASRPMPSRCWPATCCATTAASQSPRRMPNQRGCRGRQPSASVRSSVSSTSASSPTTTPSASGLTSSTSHPTALASPMRERVSRFTSVSMALCASTSAVNVWPGSN
jgi:transposase